MFIYLWPPFPPSFLPVERKLRGVGGSEFLFTASSPVIRIIPDT